MQLARSRGLTAAALSAGLLLAACGGGDDDDSGSTPSGEERLSLEFGTPSDTLSSSFYAFVAAQELGYWEEENLDVELVPGSGSGALVEQMAAGNLPAGAPSLPAVIEGLGAGLDLVNIYTYSYGSIFNIRVPEDSSIQSVADLKGRTVGVAEPGGGENAVLASALQDVGLDPVTDVTTIPIGAGEATTLDAIETGRVDAYASSKNDMFSLQVSGLQLRDMTPPEFDEFPGRAIITTPDAFEANKEALTRMMRGIAKATLFCDQVPDACQDFMVETVPEQWVGSEEGQDSQGSLQLEEAIRTTSVPEGEDFGRHDEEATTEFKELFASTIEGFEEFEVASFLNDEILAAVNDFDRDAVMADAEEYK
jgi:NitT/TauT family transport system substrate-binding protein